MTNEEIRELLDDYINFHQMHNSITNQQYSELKSSAKKYVDGVIEIIKTVIKRILI